MAHLLRAALVAGALALTLLPAQARNLVTNGDFEGGFASVSGNFGDRPTGWTVVNGAADYGYNEPSWAYVFAADSEATKGSIEQVLATIPGATYTLQYAIKLLGTGAETPVYSIRSYVDGVQQVSNPATHVWSPYSGIFTAQGATTTLTFTGWANTTSGGVGVDAVEVRLLSVPNVPEASSLMLLLPGLAPVAMALRRSRAR